MATGEESQSILKHRCLIERLHLAYSLRQASLQSSGRSDQNLELLPLAFIVIAEESLHLIEQLGIELFQTFDVPMQLGMDCDCDQAVVADPYAAILALLRFDGADGSYANDAAHWSRIIEQKQNVRPVCDCRAIGQAPFRLSADDLPVLRSATMS